MTFARIALVGVVLAAGAAHAADRTDPNARMREEVMEEIGTAMKVLGDMATDKAAFDAAAAEAAKARLIEETGKIAQAFNEPGATDPASEAKPEIWTGWDDFLKKAGAVKAAAEAADVRSLDAVKASVGTLGGACKDCHTTYRMQK